MNTHITKELALWLKERGCELECTHYWESKILGYTGGDFRRAVFSKDEFTLQSEYNCYMHAVPSHYQDIPAYTYYDILVTHAQEFWGEGEVCGDCGRKLKPDTFHTKKESFSGFRCDCGFQVHPFFTNCYEHHSSELLQLLQQNKIQEAEDYIKKHSVFANKEKK